MDLRIKNSEANKKTMKFKYNYLTNQLSKIDPNNPEYSYQIEDQFEGNFGANGFILGESS